MYHPTIALNNVRLIRGDCVDWIKMSKAAVAGRYENGN
jgi:hypothetical protein